METRANYVIVGIFTVAAILAAFGFVYWTAAIGDRGETALLRIRIPGSASGLGRGSFVLFNGVKVGDQLSVLRVTKEIKDPATGNVLRRLTTSVGTVKATDVDDVSTICSPVSGSGFKAGDMVKTVTQ